MTPLHIFGCWLVDTWDSRGIPLISAWCKTWYGQQNSPKQWMAGLPKIATKKTMATLKSKDLEWRHPGLPSLHHCTSPHGIGARCGREFGKTIIMPSEIQAWDDIFTNHTVVKYSNRYTLEEHASGVGNGASMYLIKMQNFRICKYFRDHTPGFRAGSIR